MAAADMIFLADKRISQFPDGRHLIERDEKATI
jgi:hypothetical protein